MFDFFTMDAENYDDRKVARWDSDDELKMVSTVAVSDGREPFETAVMHPAYNDGKMVVVACYSTLEQAQDGHDKWLKLLQADKLPQTLVDCGNAMICQIIDTIGGTMSFERDKSYKPKAESELTTPNKAD